MIVVDTNVVAYLFLGGEKTLQARSAFQKDPVWAAPVLWRSEFRNVLAAYLRQEKLALSDALDLVREAELILQGAEFEVESGQVLSLVSSSRCSAYDCEFVALARQIGVPLVTSDGQILSEFPATAMSLDVFAAR
ncbi:MAG: type II toxin-antitoxin system VapC family toxin [Candidatus Tectomicrobia bacterium]|uniref:Ribonuclease VapC n=1 Tax=Tectimicrobiota bacterium TaxID=2528274 RepID=A0A932GRD3_UNCTE|nr:type II toxin-antitoxin system VapC family toxin [Candidatus Tectomicrobia bacterium]